MRQQSCQEGQGGGQSYSVYLLHFDRPYWTACQHYVGYTKDMTARMEKHRAGKGSLLVGYALAHGIDFSVVAVEQFDSRGEARCRERRIKLNGGGKRICPLCKNQRIGG